MKNLKAFVLSILSASLIFVGATASLAQAEDGEVGGYCPVCIMKGELVKGNSKYFATYRGKKYVFDTAEDRRMFVENPELYTHGLELKYEQMKK